MSISEVLSSGRRGLVDCDGREKIDSAVIAADMPAGVLLCPNGEGLGKLPASAADVAKGLGFLVYISNKTLTTAGLEYADKDSANYCYHGDVWVIVEEAVTTGDPVFVRHTASGGNTQLGACRNDADTATAAALPNCRFISTTSGSGIAKVRVNLPGETADVTTAEDDIATLQAQMAATVGDSASYTKAAAGTNTLLSSNADYARVVTGVVEVDVTIADGDGAQPTFKIGKTGSTEFFVASAELTAGAANLKIPFAGDLATGEAVIVTVDAGSGTTQAGTVRVSVNAQISE